MINAAHARELVTSSDKAHRDRMNEVERLIIRESVKGRSELDMSEMHHSFRLSINDSMFYHEEYFTDVQRRVVKELRDAGYKVEIATRDVQIVDHWGEDPPRKEIRHYVSVRW